MILLINLRISYNNINIMMQLSIGSDDDVCVLHLIYEHGGGSAATA